MIYLLKEDNVPWSDSMKFKDKADRDRYNALSKENSITNGSLFEGVPLEFSMYFKSVRSLGFNDKPDYSYLRKLLRDLMKSKHLEYDLVYDWTIFNQTASRA
jgi:hypothetical protein